MILVDTSVWVNHLHTADPALQRLLELGQVLGHPWVTGELAVGQLRQPEQVLGLLSALPTADVVTPPEMLRFIDRFRLMGRGIGFVDVQLLAATQLAVDARLWTHDRRLGACAIELGLAAG